MDRSQRRKYERQQEFAAHQLFNFCAEYVALIEGKSKKETKQIYDSYELKWKLYVQSHQGKKGQLVELNLNGFKQTTSNKKAMKQLKIKMWKNWKPSIWDRIKAWFK